MNNPTYYDAIKQRWILIYPYNVDNLALKYTWFASSDHMYNL